MLVLSREPGETIQIGEITITVCRIGPNTVRLGIEAPREMNIARGELIAQPTQATQNKAFALSERLKQRAANEEQADKPAPLMTTQTKELAD